MRSHRFLFYNLLANQAEDEAQAQALARLEESMRRRAEADAAKNDAEEKV